MSKPIVTIVQTGTSNLASVCTALTRAGASIHVANNSKLLKQAEKIVLPGVGSFGAVMTALRNSDLEKVLIEKIQGGVPTLAICLGMQLLFDASEETRNVKGLSILPGTIKRFATGTRTPHLGWNQVQTNNSRWLTSGFAYFAHSYYLPNSTPFNAEVAVTDYGTSFIAAFETSNILACQFHPELSGSWGAALIRRWLEGSTEC